jgi:hypothetical protein
VGVYGGGGGGVPKIIRDDIGQRYPGRVMRDKRCVRCGRQRAGYDLNNGSKYYCEPCRRITNIRRAKWKREHGYKG